MVPVRPRSKRIPGLCNNVHCNRSVVKGANKVKTEYCDSCRSRLRRMKDPMKYSWENKKNQCRQRKSDRFPNGIPFTLTLEAWKKYCRKVRFIQNANEEKVVYDCDRILETEGYHEWNIQPLRKADNFKKYQRTKKLHYEWWSKSAVVKTEVEEDYSNDPNAF